MIEVGKVYRFDDTVFLVLKEEPYEFGPVHRRGRPGFRCLVLTDDSGVDTPGTILSMSGDGPRAVEAVTVEEL
jgi:hypothetical protein